MGKKDKKKKGKNKNKAHGGEYDPTADMFGGVTNAPMPGSGVWIQPGVYHMRIEAFKRKMSSKQGEGAMTINEFTVLDTLVEYEGSNKPGSRPAWIVKNKWGDSAHSARKGLVVAALGCDPSEVTPNLLQDLTDPSGAKTIVGLEVVATAVQVPTKGRNGVPGVFTKVTFDTLEAYAAPEPKKKKKKKKSKE